MLTLRRAPFNAGKGVRTWPNRGGTTLPSRPVSLTPTRCAASTVHLNQYAFEVPADFCEDFAEPLDGVGVEHFHSCSQEKEGGMIVNNQNCGPVAAFRRCRWFALRLNNALQNL